MEIKRLVRGEEAAIVEAGSEAEASMKAIGFVEEGSPEPEEADEQPAEKRGPGRPRKK
jgi:hypothetical protein